MTTRKSTKQLETTSMTPMKMSENPHGAPIESRVGRLEGAMETLTREIQETSHNVREIATNIGRFKEDVLAHIGAATAPKWPMIVSCIAILLTMMMLIGSVVLILLSGQSDAIKVNQASIIELRQRDYEQRFTDGQFEQALSTLLQEHRDFDRYKNTGFNKSSRLNKNNRLNQ